MLRAAVADALPTPHMKCLINKLSFLPGCHVEAIRRAGPGHLDITARSRQKRRAAPSAAPRARPYTAVTTDIRLIFRHWNIRSASVWSSAASTVATPPTQGGPLLNQRARAAETMGQLRLLQSRTRTLYGTFDDLFTSSSPAMPADVQPALFAAAVRAAPRFLLLSAITASGQDVGAPGSASRCPTSRAGQPKWRANARENAAGLA
jgi:hypothetical protein